MTHIDIKGERSKIELAKLGYKNFWLFEALPHGGAPPCIAMGGGVSPLTKVWGPESNYYQYVILVRAEITTSV